MLCDWAEGPVALLLLLDTDSTCLFTPIDCVDRPDTSSNLLSPIQRVGQAGSPQLGIPNPTPGSSRG